MDETASNLRSDDQSLRLQALSYLSSLDSDEHINFDIVRNALEVLREEESKLQITGAMVAFQKLCTFEKPKAVLRVDGVSSIGVFVNHLTSFDENIKHMAVDIVLELSTEDSLRPSLVDADCLLPVLGIMQSETGKLQQQASIILDNIAGDERCSPKLLEPDIMNPLVVLLDVTDPTVQRYAVDFFRNLVNSHDTVLGVGQAGAIEPLLKLLREGRDGEVKISVAEILLVLAKHETVREWIGESDGMEVFVDVLTDETVLDPDLKQTVADVLYHTSAADSNKRALVEGGCAGPLRSVMTRSSNRTRLRRTAVEVVETVAGHPDSTEGLLNAGIMETLLKMLREVSDSSLRDSVARAIQGFANTNYNVEQMAAMGVASVIVDLLDNDQLRHKACSIISSIADFETGGVKLIEMQVPNKLAPFLQEESSSSKISALRALYPFTQYTEGCDVLNVISGLRDRLGELSNDEYQDALVSSWSTKVLDRLRSGNKGGGRNRKSLASKRLSSGTGDANKDETNDVRRINIDLVQRYQERVREALYGKKQLRLAVNWRSMKKLKKDEWTKGVKTLSNSTPWEEMVAGISQFAQADNNNVHQFISQIKYIFLDVREERKLDVGVLVLQYSISLDGDYYDREDFSRILGKRLLGVEAAEDVRDESYETDLEELRKLCRDPATTNVGDIHRLYFFLETTCDHLWRPNFVEVQAIEKIKQEILDTEHAEICIKAWKVIKLNKNGMRQERFLVLTNWAYYTIAYDFGSNKVDQDHCKMHDLDRLYLVDIGYLKKTSKKSSRAHLSGSQKTWALNIATMEEKHSGIAKPNPEDQGNRDGSAQSYMEHNNEQGKRFRPDTSEMYNSIFLAPLTVDRAKRRYFLEEIAWTMYTASCMVNGEFGFEPFYHDIFEPEGGVMSKLYNNFKIGLKSKGERQAKE
eukprot:gb/GECH01009666.1/.p1 GENE.gb/GECH01009666.1/~~gb/GECH01009666.1/.p1  ORF type:complete len:924 (+),score=190.26 gb/GECH01009666.1/:1-2772(+)